MSDQKNKNKETTIQNNSFLELRNITKTFLSGKIIANDNISLSILENEIHAIVGENGSGKSTLMNIIFGLYKQDKGDIFIKDQKVDMFSSGAAKKHKIGMVHQHFHLIEEFTVLENIILGQEQPKIDQKKYKNLKNNYDEVKIQLKNLKEKNWNEQIFKTLQKKENKFYKSKIYLEKLNFTLDSLVKEIKEENKLLLKNNNLEILKQKLKLENESDDKKKLELKQKIEKISAQTQSSKLKKLILKRDSFILKIDEQKVIINEHKNEYLEFSKKHSFEKQILEEEIKLNKLKSELKSFQISKFGILSYPNAKKRLILICEKYGITLELDKKVNSLSVGKRQMVEILKVLWEEKQLIVFDEPTATLSINEIESLMKTILLLKKEGKTIIFISHKLNEVKQISDSISILKRGVLQKTYLNNGNLNIDKIVKEMIGKNIQIDYPKRKIADKILLNVENLSYETAKGFLALNNINFKVKEDEIFGLAGIEGNGQEEVIKILTGLRKPKVGKIVFKDQKIVNFFGEHTEYMPIRERNKFISHIPIDRTKHGIIPQKPLFFNSILTSFDHPTFSQFWLTKKDEKTKKIINDNFVKISILKQNLKDLKRNKNAPAIKIAEQNIKKIKAENHHKIRKLKGFSISINYDTVDEHTKKIISYGKVEGAFNNNILIKNLSGGNQQKFVFSREVLKQHQLLIAGHPTRGLDISAIDYLYRKMIDNSKGKATVLYSLEINELMAICDRMAIFYKGKIVDIIDPKKTSFEKISKMMVGQN